ncbi:MAG: aminoacyl-tRNA hydrolase [Treponema sp.]|nr:MAG: aminoacyl-tRNA hydrolase [Treponema sp.]
MIKLIAFLGNYGKKYENTRHNAAWVVLPELDIWSRLSWQNKFRGEYAKCVHPADSTESLHFLKPHTYMNLSGESVGELAKFFKLKCENILVVHDELEIKPATISLKWAGGLGGHNGLRSIKAALGTPDFWRLKIGIGKPQFENADIAGYVLSAFSKSELSGLNRASVNLNDLLNKVLNCKNQGELKVLLNGKPSIKIELKDEK